MSKYKPLWDYLKENNKDKYEMTFEKIRDILYFDIDHSFLSHKKELKEYGYKVEKISLKNKFVIFIKI